MSETARKIGVVIANYNGGKYFKRCLIGLLEQTVVPDYIVVVDDKSTDNSVDIIINTLKELNFQTIANFFVDNQEYTQYTNESNIKIILSLKEENSGPAATRNVALKFLLNNVDIICINDIDDIYYPTKIEKSIEVLNKYKHVGLVYSDYDVFNENTGKKTREYKEIFSYNRLFEECIVSNNSVMSSEMIKKIGLYDESLFGPEDYDMWLRLSEISAVYHIPESLYQYSITGNNITVTTPSSKFAKHVNKVRQKALERSRGNLV